MKKKIIFVTKALWIGGIETALVNLLKYFDYDKICPYYHQVYSVSNYALNKNLIKRKIYLMFLEASYIYFEKFYYFLELLNYDNLVREREQLNIKFLEDKDNYAKFINIIKSESYNQDKIILSYSNKITKIFNYYINSN